MIYHNGRRIQAIYHNGRAVSAVYHGTRLVWQSVRSCFGRGWWIPKKPFIGKDKWKYN